MDHQNILGTTLEKIAEQKFGVIGKQNQVLSFPIAKELQELKLSVMNKTHCSWMEFPAFQLQGMNQLITPWGCVTMTLPGKRAAENTTLALQVFSALGFDPARYLDAIPKVRWNGRFQKVKIPGIAAPVYLSGDHNEQGIDSLLEILKGLQWNRIHIVVGVGKDKDCEMIFKKLSQIPRSRFYLTETTFKPLPLESYPQTIKDCAVVQERNLNLLLTKVGNESRTDDVVLVTGSLYLVGEVLKNLKQTD